MQLGRQNAALLKLTREYLTFITNSAMDVIGGILWVNPPLCSSLFIYIVLLVLTSIGFSQSVPGVPEIVCSRSCVYCEGELDDQCRHPPSAQVMGNHMTHCNGRNQAWTQQSVSPFPAPYCRVSWWRRISRQISLVIDPVPSGAH